MKKEYIYASISILFWGSTAAVTKLLLKNLNSMQILFVTSFFAFAFLFIVNILKKNLGEFKKYNLKEYIEMGFIGMLGTFLYALFLYLGIDLMLAQEAFIINYLWPIMIVIFAWIILKEPITLRKVIAILLSFLGVVIVITKGNLVNIQLNSIKGTLFCSIAAVCYGLFSVLNKKKNYNNYFSMMIYYLTSFIASSIFVLIYKNIPVINLNQLLGLLWSGVFTSAIAFTSWTLALKHGNTVNLSNLALLTPFISLIYIYLFLHEPIKIHSIVGLVIIIIGIIIQMKDNKKTILN